MNSTSSSSGTGSGINQAAAVRVCDFFESMLRHSKGKVAGEPFHLLPWQRTMLSELFGTLKPDGTRQYRTAYIELPKKQGKSTTLAGLAIYLLLADGEPGAEVYGAASDREQAGIIYREAASMVRASPALSKHLEVIDSRKSIVHKKSNSFYRVLSADAFRAEGLACAPRLRLGGHKPVDTEHSRPPVRRVARSTRPPSVGCTSLRRRCAEAATPPLDHHCRVRPTVDLLGAARLCGKMPCRQIVRPHVLSAHLCGAAGLRRGRFVERGASMEDGQPVSRRDDHG